MRNRNYVGKPYMFILFHTKISQSYEPSNETRWNYAQTVREYIYSMLPKVKFVPKPVIVIGKAGHQRLVRSRLRRSDGVVVTFISEHSPARLTAQRLNIFLELISLNKAAFTLHILYLLVQTYCKLTAGYFRCEIGWIHFQIPCKVNMRVDSYSFNNLT